MADQREQRERRQRILRAAERLLQHYGFAKTTVADIAREAHVGVGSVYLEFASKEAIIATLSAQVRKKTLEAMRACCSSRASYAVRIRGLLDSRLEHMCTLSQQGHHGLDLLRCGCPAVAEVNEQFREHEEQLLVELLEQGTAAGELAVDDPEDVAALLLKIYDCFAPSPGSPLPIDGIRPLLELTHDLVFHGLLRR